MDVNFDVSTKARRNEYERAGFWFACGALRLVWLCLVAVLVVGALLDALNLRATDSTDASSTARSGVRLRTDYGTGCQYLETVDGGITPRLDRSGKLVCGGL